MIQFATTHDILSQTIKNYVAVSYVWSQCKSIDRLVQRISTHMHIGGLNSLPVWLDQISNKTIDGNNDDYGIKNMNKIYSKATVTIANVPEVTDYKNWINNPSVRLDAITQDEYKYKNANKYYNLNNIAINDINGVYDVIAEENFVNALATSEWFTRAWTFQEQVLSDKIEIMIDDIIIDITNIVHNIIVMNILGKNIMDMYNWSFTEMWYVKDDDQYAAIMKQRLLESIKKNVVKLNVTHANLAQTKYNIILHCNTSSLALLDAIGLVSNRLMGKENKRYEPIQSLFKLQETLYGNSLIYPLRVIISDERRDTTPNRCWLPSRLNTGTTYTVENIYFKIEDNDTITIRDAYYLLLPLSNRIQVFIGTNHSERVFMNLKIVKRRHIDIIDTHFERLIKPRYNDKTIRELRSLKEDNIELTIGKIKNS